MPLARARAFQSSIPLIKGVAKTALYGAQLSHSPALGAPRRALDPCEHSFTVRVPRAGGRPGCPFPASLGLLISLHGRVACLVSHCARRTRAFLGRAFREHRRSTGHPPSPFLRGHPRMPCRFKSPRIERASPSHSEPLNFLHCSLISIAPPHRHSGCSSIWPTGGRIADGKGGAVGRYNILKRFRPMTLDQ